MKNLIATLLVSLSSAAFADVTFVNLADYEVRISRYTFTDGNSGGYNEEGWVFKGWTVVQPGGVHTSASNHFYVERRDTQKRIAWQGLDGSPGYVKKNAPFEDLLPRGGNAKKRFLDRGYVEVQFQTFKNQLYTISGTAYRIAQKTIPFSYESRSVQFLNESFQVNGKPISIDVNDSSRGARDISWKISDRSVGFSGSIEGKQTTPFGAREKGYYSGSVTVKYVARE